MNRHPAEAGIPGRATVLFISAMLLCLEAFGAAPDFGDRKDWGALESALVDEASGVAVSPGNPSVFWTHNDDTGDNRLFAFSSGGRHLGIYYVNGAICRDWEDIAAGPGPMEGKSYLYVGDIGDNSAVRGTYYIHRIIEPQVETNQFPVSVTLTNVEIMAYQYPDGARDAETLMVDPQTLDIYVVSKRESLVRVYRAAYPQSTSSTTTLDHVLTLTFTGATGGDIAPSGNQVLIKTYSAVYWWERLATQTVTEALGVAPQSVPYVAEPQGEAIGWGLGDAGYFTVSEGSYPHIYFYTNLASAISDFDQDGMYDDWERRQFGSTTNSTGNEDRDLDTFRDYAEFIAGTQPTNPLSRLELTDITQHSPSEFILSWPSVSNRTYTIHYAPTDIVGTAFSPLSTNLAATAPLNTYTVTVDALQRTYFQIGVSWDEPGL